jgi:hypothetical protein
MVCVVLWWLRRSNLTKSAVFICLRLQVQVYRFLHLKLISRQVTETAESWNAGPFFGLASLSSSVVALAWYILYFFLSVWISGSVAVLVAVVLWFTWWLTLYWARMWRHTLHLSVVLICTVARQAVRQIITAPIASALFVLALDFVTFATLKYLHTL